MNLKPLTPDEIQEEFQIEKHRIAFLDAKLAALSPEQKQQLITQLAETTRQACEMAIQKLVQWKIIERPQATINLGLVIMSSSDPEAITDYGRLCSGKAFPHDGVIGILDHLALAPKEVARNVAAHECLHILYPLRLNKDVQSQPVRMEISLEYPEDLQVEEERVRQLDSKVCGYGNSLELWETAIDTHGDNWRYAYQKLRTRLGPPRRRGKF